YAAAIMCLHELVLLGTCTLLLHIFQEDEDHMNIGVHSRGLGLAAKYARAPTKGPPTMAPTRTFGFGPGEL
ncbi:hypothetical protein AKJ16_DCAP18372, partial [Drosera capensis]